MPTFDTPAPIAATVDLRVGSVEIAASERSETTVEVRPHLPSRPSDIRTAQETQVDFSEGRLRVIQPRHWRSYSWFSDGGSVDVHISVPVGSEVTGEVAAGSWRTTGRLGSCRVKVSAGDIEVDEAGPVRLRSGSGDISARLVAGLAELTTGSGAIHVGTVGGPAVVKNSNGETLIGEVTGDLRVQAGNGAVTVERAGASVAAKTGYGDVRLGTVSRGGVVVGSGYGGIEIGVVDGVAAWLDLSTGFGDVVNELEASSRPAPGDATVEVRARTGFGDVTVRRAAAPATAR